jgi:RIO kinase 1
MKVPKELQALIDDGVVDEVLRQLDSGKEATVFVVRAGKDIRCAKVYKNMSRRSFQARAQYREGRQVRGSRQGRAMDKRTRFGRQEEEAAWKNTEVDALYRLQAAGVRVPQPYGFIDGVLVMELVTDAEGHTAPRLGSVEFTPEQARHWHAFMIEQIKKMLCAGLVHGDLSEYNVLYGTDGPVIIDLPQAVEAAANNNAQAMLLRDVANVTATFAYFAPELRKHRYAEEMWALFARGELRPDTELTGVFEGADDPVDLDEVRAIIEDAKAENERRQRGRDVAEGRAKPPEDEPPAPGEDGYE